MTYGRMGVSMAVAYTLILAPSLVAWEVEEDAPGQALEEFHRHFSAAAFHFPRHGAAPLGPIGFELYLDATYDPRLADEPFAEAAIQGDLPGDVLSIARVGARKGLPGGLDIGASYGRVLGSDLELISGDLQWALLRGGALTPALSFRLSVSQSAGGGVYRLRQYGVEALISKKLAFVTPYAGAALIRGEGTFRRSGGGPFETTETQPVLYAGLSLDFLIPRLTLELEQTESLQAALGVGFGF